MSILALSMELINDNENIVSKDSDVLFQELLDYEDDILMIMEELSELNNLYEKNQISYESLVSIINAVDKYGWDKSIIAYMDPDGEFQKQDIIPSIENITASMEASNYKEKLATLAAKIWEFIKKIYKGIIRFVSNMFTSFTNIFKTTRKILEVYTEKKLKDFKLDNLDEEKAKNTKIKIVTNSKGKYDYSAYVEMGREFTSETIFKIIYDNLKKSLDLRLADLSIKIPTDNAVEVLVNHVQEQLNKFGVKFDKKCKITNLSEVKKSVCGDFREIKFGEIYKDSEKYINLTEQYLKDIKNLDNFLDKLKKENPFEEYVRKAEKELKKLKIDAEGNDVKEEVAKQAQNRLKEYNTIIMNLHKSIISLISAILSQRKSYEKSLAKILITIDKCKK